MIEKKKDFFQNEPDSGSGMVSPATTDDESSQNVYDTAEMFVELNLNDERKF